MVTFLLFQKKRCMFTGSHEPAVPALLPMALTLCCTSQNLLTFIFPLSTWINLRENDLVSDCTNTSSCSIFIFPHIVVLNRLFQKVHLHHATYPVNRAAWQWLLVPEFSKSSLLQQAKGALLSNVSGLKTRLCWTKHPDYQSDLVPAAIPINWRTYGVCCPDCKERVISGTHCSSFVSSECGSSGW